MKLLDHTSGAWAGFIGGAEVINLTASLLLTIAFVPYGIQIIRVWIKKPLPLVRKAPDKLSAKSRCRKAERYTLYQQA